MRTVKINEGRKLTKCGSRGVFQISTFILFFMLNQQSRISATMLMNSVKVLQKKKLFKEKMNATFFLFSVCGFILIEKNPVQRNGKSLNPSNI